MDADTIVGNESFMDTFTRELQNALTGSWLVVGPGQSGRTKMCGIVFGRAGLECVRVSCETGAVKELVKSMEPHRDALTISSFFNPKPKVLLLDDFDIYGDEKPIQTYVLNFLKHHNFTSSGLRVVMVVTTSNEKHFKDMAKKMSVLRVQNPRPEQALEYVIQRHPTIDKERLEQLCVEMMGNIGGVLNRICFLEQGDSYSTLIKDRTAHDILHLLFGGKINSSDADALYTYEPRVMAMLYFDNMNRYATQGDTRRQGLAKMMADMHILEERVYGSGQSGMVSDLWSYMLCSQPALVNGTVTPRVPYEHTKILCRTANRCNLNKRMYRMLQSLGVDQNSREVLFDVLSDLVLTRGKRAVDEEAYALCREYLQTVGEIKKEQLDKFQMLF